MEGYTPFKMKAKDYGNSPMLMNFPDSFPGGVGSSPAKGWFKNIAKKVKNLGKKVLGKSLIGKALGIGKEKKDPSMATADATATAIQPHTHDETGAIVPEGEEAGKTDLATVDPSTLTDPILRMAAMKKQGMQASGTGIVKKNAIEATKRAMSGVGGGSARSGWLGLSDIRLKENINNTGVSPSGIPIYEFNYIGDTNRYSGAMAQDLLKTNPDAVSMDTSGYYTVNYNNIDVDMHLLN